MCNTLQSAFQTIKIPLNQHIVSYSIRFWDLWTKPKARKKRRKNQTFVYKIKSICINIMLVKRFRVK